MTSRAEITTRYARAFQAADRRTKGRILDEMGSVTDWSRDNAPTSAGQRDAEPAGSGPLGRHSAAQAAGEQLLLRHGEDPAAGPGGLGRAVRKYLAASMRTQLDGLERHGELVDGVGRSSMAVRAELLAMSAASIDRYLRPAKATGHIRGVPTLKPSPLLRSSIKIRKAGDEVEAEAGFFEGDTIAHCGPTLRGEFVRT